MNIRELFTGLYKTCDCGCGYLILCISEHRGELARYKSGHNSKGETHPNWKGGKVKSGKYWKLWMPEHPKATVDGYIREHRLIYERHYNVCLLSWADIHHINGNTSDNRIENLQAMINSDHTILHQTGNTNIRGKHKDTSDRRCFNCGSGKTFIKKPYGWHKTPYPVWNHLPWDKINWYCNNCYRKLKNRR